MENSSSKIVAVYLILIGISAALVAFAISPELASKVDISDIVSGFVILLLSILLLLGKE